MFHKDLRVRFLTQNSNWVRGYFMRLLGKELFSIMKGKELMPE